MNVIICNNPEKKIYSESYDKVIYLGYTPDKELNDNEGIILNSDSIQLKDWIISIKGLSNANKPALDKSYLQNNYKRQINQIVLNDRNTNYSFETNRGEKIEFVALKGHRELEI